MSGKIYPDNRDGCPCGSNKYSSKFEIEPNIYIPICSCGKAPTKFRITAYYPDPSNPSGRSRTSSIRYTDQGQRITNIADAIHMLKQIEKEILDGSFNPDKYTSKVNREGFLIKNLLREYIKFNELRISDPDYPLTQRTIESKRSIAQKYLSPHFGDLDIQFIRHEIKKRFRDVTSNRRRVWEELNSFFKFCKEEIEIIFQPPIMPKKPRKRLVNAQDIPDITALSQIIQHINNPVVKAVIEICGLYLLRPCDVQPLKHCDIDIEKGILTINRHISMGKVISGRKSDSLKLDSTPHTLPITQELFRILSTIPTPISSNDYYFQNKKGSDCIHYQTIMKCWHIARKKAGFPKVKLYEATKHAAVVKLVEQNVPSEKIRRITGISAKAIEHYARLKASDISNDVILLSTFR